MEPGQILFLTGCIFAAATLYASVGHAGASGYIAAMALFGVVPGVMKPTALVLNILVATIATIRFYRAGCFSWSLFWPFTLASVPCAFLGGALTLPGSAYKPIVGVLLLLAALRLLAAQRVAALDDLKAVNLPLALLFGGGIGLLSGLTGTGGGIFLSPLLIFMGWAETRQTSGVSAAFILVNSVAGLAGNLSSVGSLPSFLPAFIAAVLVGAVLGTQLGIKSLSPKGLQRALAVVLTVAGFKLILT